ncbi:GNAT family N-acetyltransferase [Flavobacterium aestivum]|uniref:GNAT family N-acetyltransferase n=1 Tax=Flavobacterium aestivum TaxID=3003257 RepID=UPI0022864046|nr:GNAT family N-acetyltransferase [Flavobacterium aestivum]
MKKGSQNFPTLMTERLTLRQLSINDSVEILLLRSDEEINKFLDRKPSKTLIDALNFIKIILENDETLYWAITKTGDEKLIGTICLFDFVNDVKKCEIGYELRTEYQGQGIMIEATRKVIQYAIDTLGIKSIDASTHKDNQSSTNLLQKLNFKNLESIEAENPNLILFRLTQKI